MTFCQEIITLTHPIRRGCVKFFMNELQKSQNKLFRFLNNTRISDKINTKSIAANLKMLSANQINAQVKLTEMWKASNIMNYPVKLDKKDPNTDNMLTRSTARGDILLQGKSDLCNSSFIFDASKIWNSAPCSIKNSKTIYKAKKEIKKYVCTLPL